jgi:hypothetical protein
MEAGMKINWRLTLGALGLLILSSHVVAQKNPLSGVHKMRVEDVKRDNTVEGFRHIEVSTHSGKMWYSLACTEKAESDHSCPYLETGKTYAVTIKQGTEGVFVVFDSIPEPNELIFVSASTSPL